MTPLWLCVMTSLETNGKDHSLQYCLRADRNPQKSASGRLSSSVVLLTLCLLSASPESGVNLGQLAGQKNRQFGKWRRMWLKGLSHFGGFGCPDTMIQPLAGLGRGWFTCKVGPLRLLAATEEAEGTGLWSASALTSCWLAVPVVTLQLLF